MKMLILIGLVVLFGCATHHPDRDRESDRKKVEDELSGEMSLKADRDELANLRKEIPQDRRRSNDELALYLQLMKQGKEQPQMVRDKFAVIVQKKRTSFRDKVAKLRESYHHSEAKRRDEFLDEQKTARETFMKTKRTPDQTRDYFGDQDKARQEFFAEERTRRQSFETEIDSQSKDFDSYMREKTNEFNEQYRLYSKQFSEKPREKNAVTGESSSDFKQLDQVPAKALGTDD